jgi:hypothetical protein
MKPVLNSGNNPTFSSLPQKIAIISSGSIPACIERFVKTSPAIRNISWYRCRGIRGERGKIFALLLDDYFILLSKYLNIGRLIWNRFIHIIQNDFL